MTNRWRRALAAPSGLFLLAVLAAGLAAPLLPLADPTAIDISSKFLPPSLEHPFGTDLLGRDMLSRMIWGIRTTFVTALLTMIVTALRQRPEAGSMRSSCAFATCGCRFRAKCSSWPSSA